MLRLIAIRPLEGCYEHIRFTVEFPNKDGDVKKESVFMEGLG